MERFEAAGIWWEAESDERDTVGILRFEPADGFRLEIPFGGTGELDDFADRVNASARTPLIHGFLRNGKYVTLPDAVMTDWSVNFPGGRREEHRSLLGFVGPVTCDANPTLDQLRVRYSHLRDWVVTHPTRMVQRVEDQRFTGEVEYRYEPTEQTELSRGDGWRLVLGHTARQSLPSVTGFSVTHDCMLTLELDEPSDFETVNERFLSPLWQFLSFCVDASVDVSELEIRLPDGENWLKVGHAQTLARDPEKAIGRDFMLLSMPVLGERLSTVLATWMAIDGDLRRAVSIMVGLGTDRSEVMDLQFVASAQALEAMARVGVDDRDLPREELRRRRRIVRDSIEDEVVREWACDRLSFNRRSADDLLRDLLDRIGPYTSQLVPDRERFLRDHRTNRNYYAHRSDAEQALLEPGELYVHTQGIMLLLKAATLLMLGYTQDQVRDIMSSCQGCASWARTVAGLYGVEVADEPA